MDVQNYMDRLEEQYQNPYIQIPNKLITNINYSMRSNDYESYSHYAFCHLLINGFLYKYSHYLDLENGEYLNTGNIKELLKYNPRSQKIDKVSKRNGILEIEGFCETTTDIPVAVYREDRKGTRVKERFIVPLSQSGEDLKEIIYKDLLRTPNFYVCIPEFMIDYNKKKGTLNNYSDTFTITLKEVQHFLYSDDFNLREFYLYCYIKSYENKDATSTFSYDTIKRQTGISRETATKIFKKFESKGIVDIQSNGNSGRLKKNSNTYKIKSSFKKEMSYPKKQRVAT